MRPHLSGVAQERYLTAVPGAVGGSRFRRSVFTIRVRVVIVCGLKKLLSSKYYCGGANTLWAAGTSQMRRIFTGSSNAG